jgi:hypothetical protein
LALEDGVRFSVFRGAVSARNVRSRTGTDTGNLTV